MRNPSAPTKRGRMLETGNPWENRHDRKPRTKTQMRAQEGRGMLRCAEPTVHAPHHGSEFENSICGVKLDLVDKLRLIA